MNNKIKSYRGIGSEDSREVWLMVLGLDLKTTSSSPPHTVDNCLLRLDLLGLQIFLGRVALDILPQPLGGFPVIGNTMGRGTTVASSTTTWLNWATSLAARVLTRLLSLNPFPQFQVLLANRTARFPSRRRPCTSHRRWRPELAEKIGH